LGTQADSDRRLIFGPGPESVKVFTEIKRGQRVLLQGIDSLEQNNAVADCILDELWRHTEKSGNRLVVSIAGGYKSMSALMMSCLSILGRVQDRVTHVLVDASYEMTRPGFLYPGQPQQELVTRDGRTVLAKKAAIRLFDVPWVPFRVLFEKELRKKPASYSLFVDKLRGALPAGHLKPTYRWNPVTKEAEVEVGPQRYLLRSRPAPLFEFLLRRAEKGHPPYPDHYAAAVDLEKFLSAGYAGKDAIGWGGSKTKFDLVDIRRVLEQLRKAAPGLLVSSRGVVGLLWSAGPQK
jgi:hypothetical protein